jgi:DNA-binding transcriptional MerR regulator
MSNTTESDPLIPASKVRKDLGGVSDVTLWRWEKKGAIPPPVRINNRRYWRLSVVEAMKGAA